MDNGINDVDATLAMHAQPYADLNAHQIGPAPEITHIDMTPTVGLPGVATNPNGGPLNTIGQQQGPQPESPATTAPNQTYQQGQVPYANVSPSPNANPMAGTPFGKMYDQQAGALGGLNKATQDYMQSTGAAMKAYQDQQKALFDSQQAHLQKIQGELDASRDAYMKGHIDPNRLWNDSSIGNKIGAGLSIILGGIGSGLSGQPNQALSVIDKMVDKDIMAQQNEQDKNKSLFGMNLQRYGNQQAADAATRLQLYNGLQTQLQQKGLGLQSAQAQANYQMGMAGLQERMVPLQIQLANFSAMRQANAGGLPANYPTEGMSQEFQDKLVNVPTSQGVIKVPAQSKEAATDFRKSEVELNNIDANLKNLKQVYSSVGVGSLIPGTAAHASLADASNAVKLSLGQLVNLKRINGYEAEKYEKMLPGPYSMNSAAAMAQIQQVENFIKNSRNASYSGLLNNFNPGGIKEGTPSIK